MFRMKTLGMILVLLPAVSASAETLILKDGTFVKGVISLKTSKTVHIETRFGTRTYALRDIEQIIESVSVLDPDAVNTFSQLPPVLRTVLNAQAEYDLGQYQRALERLESVGDHDQSLPVRIRIDWLLIEINERLGKWSEVRRTLEDKKKNGAPSEQIRAKAHLAIFDANPNYDLRYVGEKHARNFIRDEAVRNRAKMSDALKDHEIMRFALREYCEQLLTEDEMSVKAFADKLDPEATYQACRKMPRTGSVSKRLPYMDDLKRAERTLANARAILGDYGSAFELDLVRTELHHLLPIMERLFDEATALSPEDFTPDFDATTGVLTRAGRQQWRERCDAFLSAAQPIIRILEHMVERVERFPNGLRELRKALTEINERAKQIVRAVKKARNRTHV